ncbi:MAG: hypothetical protein ACP5G1_00735 [Nanopusillaceae archaeon]
MRSIHIYIEYILLILLSAISFYLVYSWWENNKIYAINFLNRGNFEYQANFIAQELYNLENSLYFNIQYNLENYNIFCVNNFTVIQSDNLCQTTLNNFTYQGDLIEYYGSYYFYDPKFNGYYLLENRYNSILYGCYESYLSIIILTNNCTGMCVGNCNIRLIKNGTAFYSYIYS